MGGRTVGWICMNDVWVWCEHSLTRSMTVAQVASEIYILPRLGFIRDRRTDAVMAFHVMHGGGLLV